MYYNHKTNKSSGPENNEDSFSHMPRHLFVDPSPLVHTMTCTSINSVTGEKKKNLT